MNDKNNLWWNINVNTKINSAKGFRPWRHNLMCQLNEATGRYQNPKKTEKEAHWDDSYMFKDTTNMNTKNNHLWILKQLRKQEKIWMVRTIIN